MNITAYTFKTDDLGDPTAEPGSRSWLIWVANELRRVMNDTAQMTQAIRDLTGAFHRHQGWQELGFLSWEDFCEQYLHRDVVETERVLRVNGGDRRSVGFQFDNYQTETSEQMGGGTSADYLTARIARDRPDILAALRRGEYKSVRQAAIAAGIVTPKVRHSVPDDPSQAGRYLAERVDRAWMEQMIDAFYRHMEVAE